MTALPATKSRPEGTIDPFTKSNFTQLGMKTTLLSTYIRRTLCSMALLLGLGSMSAFAQTTITWTGSAGDNKWSTAANWSPATVPSLTTHIAIFPTGFPSLTVTDLPANSTVVGALRIEGTSNVTIKPGLSQTATSAITAGNTAGGVYNPAISIASGAVLTITGFNNPAGPDINLSLAQNANAAITGLIDGRLVIEQDDDINFSGTGLFGAPASGVLAFSSTSTYEHALNAGAIPANSATLTFAAGSTIKVTGSRTTLPTITSASTYHHFVFDCPNLSTANTALIATATPTVSFNGNFTVNNTGTGHLALASNSTGTATFNVFGTTTIGDGVNTAVLNLRNAQTLVTQYRMNGNLVVNANARITATSGDVNDLLFGTIGTTTTYTATGAGTVDMATQATAILGTGGNITLTPNSASAATDLTWSIANSSLLRTTISASCVLRPTVSCTLGISLQQATNTYSERSCTITGSIVFPTGNDISVQVGQVVGAAAGSINMSQPGRSHTLLINGLAQTVTAGFTISGGTVVYNGGANGQEVIVAITYNNLTLRGNLLQNNTTAVEGASAATINGVLRLESGVLGGAQTFRVNKVERIDGSATATINPVTTTYDLEYLTPTTIFGASIGSEWSATATHVNNITLNIGSGKMLYLPASKQVNGLLTFTSGYIAVQNTFALTFGSSATHTGASNTSLIYTQGSGRVDRASSSSMPTFNFTWPIGNPGQLASVQVTTATVTSGNLTLGFRTIPFRSGLMIPHANELRRHWAVIYTGTLTGLTANYNFGASEIVGSPTAIRQRAASVSAWTAVAAGTVGGTSLSGVQIAAAIPASGFEVAAGDPTAATGSFDLAGNTLSYKVLNAAAWGTAGNWIPSGVPVTATNQNLIINAAATGIPATFTCASLTVTPNGTLSGANVFTVTGDVNSQGTWSSSTATGAFFGGNVTTAGIGTLPNMNISLNGTGNQTLTFNGTPATNTTSLLTPLTNAGTRTVLLTGSSAMSFSGINIGQGVTFNVDLADPISGLTLSNNISNTGGGTTGKLVLLANRVITFTGTVPNNSNTFSTVLNNSKTDFTATGCKVRYTGTTANIFPGTYYNLEVNNAATVLPNNTVTVRNVLELRGASTLTSPASNTLTNLIIGESGFANAYVNVLSTAGTPISLQTNGGTLTIQSSINPFPSTGVNRLQAAGAISVGNLVLDPIGTNTLSYPFSISTRALAFNNANAGNDNITFDPISSATFNSVASTAFNISGANGGTLTFGTFNYNGASGSTLNINRNLKVAGSNTAFMTLTGAATTAPILNIASGVTLDLAPPTPNSTLLVQTSLGVRIIGAATSTVNFSTSIAKTVTNAAAATYGNLTNSGGQLTFGGAFQNTITGTYTNNGIVSFPGALVEFQAPVTATAIAPNITGSVGSKTTFTGSASFTTNPSFSNVDLYFGNAGTNNITTTTSFTGVSPSTVFTLGQGGSVISGAGSFNAYNWIHQGNSGSGGITTLNTTSTVANDLSVISANLQVGDAAAGRTLNIGGNLYFGGGTLQTVTATPSAVITPTINLAGSMINTSGTGGINLPFVVNGGSNSQPVLNLLCGTNSPSATVSTTNVISGTFGTAVLSHVNVGDHQGDLITNSSPSTFTVQGNFLNSGRFTATAGTVFMNSANLLSQTLGTNNNKVPGEALTFVNLTHGNNLSSQILTLGDSITVSNILRLENGTSGYFDINGNRVTVNGSTGYQNSTSAFRGDINATPGTSELIINGSIASGATNANALQFVSGFTNLKSLTHNRSALPISINTNSITITAAAGHKPSLNLLNGALNTASGSILIGFQPTGAVIRRGLGSVTSGRLSNASVTSVGYEYTATATVGAGNEILTGIAVDTLTINATGGTVTAAASIASSGKLRMTNGILSLGAINYTVTDANPFITGSNSFVDQSGAGRLTHSRAAGTASDFNGTWPIGTGSSYSPVTISGLAATVSGTRTLNVLPTASANPNFEVASLGLARFFSFTSTNITTLTAGSVAFSYVDADINGNEANYPSNVYYWDGAIWTLAGTPSVNTGANTFTAGDLNGLTTLNGTQWSTGELLAFVIAKVYSIAGGGLFTDGTKWSNTEGGAARGSAPTASEKMIIVSGHNITLTNGATTLATEIRSGASLLQDAATGVDLGSLGGTGTLGINSATAPTAVYTNFVSTLGGTIDYYGTTGFAMPNFVTYRNLTVSNTGGVTSSTNFTLNGDLTVTGKFQNTHVVTLNAASGLIAGTDSARLHNSIFPVSKTYAISNTGGVNFSGTTTGTGILTMIAGGKVGYTQAAVPYGLTTAELSKTGVTLVVNGTIAQAIPTTLFNLETNKPSGTITLAGVNTINGNLNMLSGVINYPLTATLLINGSLTVTSPGVNNMINTTGGIAGNSGGTTGLVYVSFTDPANATLTVPFGSNNKYHGLTFTNLNGAGTGYVYVSTTNAANPLTSSANTLGQYWRFGTTLGSFSANVVGTYDETNVVGTEASYQLKQSENQLFWSDPGTARSINTTANTFSITLFGPTTSFLYDLALGQPDAFIQNLYSSIATGNWSDASTWDINGVPDPAVPAVVLINSGHIVTLQSNVVLAPATGSFLVNVQPGGTIGFAGSSVLSGGANTRLLINSDAGLTTQHPLGFEQSLAQGCVQVAIRNFSFGGIYEFNGTSAQTTGVFTSALNGNGKLIINNGAMTTNNFTTNSFHKQDGFTGGVTLGRPNLQLRNNASIEIRSGVFTIGSGQTINGLGDVNPLSPNPIVVQAGALLRVDCSTTRTLQNVINNPGGISWSTTAPYGSLHLFNVGATATYTGTNAAGGNMYGANMQNFVVQSSSSSAFTTTFSPTSPITISGNLSIVGVTGNSSNANDFNLADGATIYKVYNSGGGNNTGRFNTAIGFPSGATAGINLVGENNHTIGLVFTNSELPNASSGQNITRMVFFGSGGQNMIMPGGKVFNVTGLFKFSYASGGFSMDGGGGGNQMTLSGPIELNNTVNFVGAGSTTGTLTIEGSGAVTGSGFFNNASSAFRRVTVNRAGVAIPLRGTIANGSTGTANGTLELLNGSTVNLGSNNLEVQGDLLMSGSSTVTASTGILSLTTKAGGNLITATPTGSVPNLAINNAAGVSLPTTGGTNLTVSTTLALTTGQFNIGSASSGLNTFNYNGAAPTGTTANLVATTPAGTRLVLGGTAASYALNSGITSVKYLESNNTNGTPATYSQTGNMTVLDSLVLRSGGFSFGGNFDLGASKNVLRYANANTAITAGGTLTIPSSTTVSYLAGDQPSISTGNELPSSVANIFMNAPASTVNQTPSTVTTASLNLTNGIYNLSTNKTLVYTGNTMPTSESFSYVSTLGGATAGFNWTPSSAPIGTYVIPVGPNGTVNGYRPLTLTTTAALSSATLISFANHAGGGTSDYTNVPTTGNIRSNYVAYVTNSGATFNSGLTLEAIPDASDFNTSPTALSNWAIFEGVNPGPGSWVRRGQNANGSRPSTSAYSLTRGGINFNAGATQTFVVGINGGTDMPAIATTYNWPATSGNDSWNTPSKWYVGMSVASYVPNDVLDNVEVLGGTVTIDNGSATTYTVNDVSIASGATLGITGSNGLNISGASVNNGTLTAASTTTVAYIGGNQTALQGTYGNLDLRSPAPVTKTIVGSPSSTTVNGTLFVSTGSSIANEGSLAFGASATIQKEVSAAGTADCFDNFLDVPSTINLTMIGGPSTLPIAYETPVGGNINNLTLLTGNGYSFTTTSSDVIVNGTLTLEGTGNMFVGDFAGSPAQFTVNGPIVHTGTAKLESFHTTTSRLTINGSAALPATNFVGNANTWNRITLNNSHATDNQLVIGSNNFTVSNQLNILDGRLSLDAGTLTTSGPLVATSPDGAFNFTSLSNLVTGSNSTLPTISIVNNLTIGGGGATMSGDVTVAGTLTRTGALTVGSNTLTLNGTTSGAGNIVTTSSSNLVFGGSTLTVTLPASISAVNNLTVNNSNAGLTHGISLGGPLTISGTLALTDGTLAVGSNTLNIDGPVTAATGMINANGSTIVVGGSGVLPVSVPFGPTTSAASLGTLTMNRSGATFYPLGTATPSVTIVSALNLQAGTVDGSFLQMSDNSTITPTAGATLSNFGTGNITSPNRVNYVYNSGADVQMNGEMVPAKVKNLTVTRSTLNQAIGDIDASGDITLGTGTTFSLSNGGTHYTTTFRGNLSGAGTITAGGPNYLIFGSTSGQTINNTVTLPNVNILNASTIVTATSGITTTITGDFIKAGRYVAGNSSLVLNGTYTTGTGTISTTSSTNLTLGGTTATTLLNTFFFTGPALLNNLTIGNTAGIQMGSQSLTVSGTLLFSPGAGSISTVAATSSNRIDLGLTGTVSGEAAGRYVIGRLRGRRVIAAGVSNNLAGMGVIMTGVTAPTAALMNSLGGSFQLDRITGIAASTSTGNAAQSLSANQSIRRNWVFSAVGNLPSPLNLNLFWVSDDDNENNGGTIASMAMFTRPDAGSLWTRVVTPGPTRFINADLGSGNRQLYGQATSFTDFTGGFEGAPLPVEISSLTARRVQKDVRVMWQTVTEKNANRFEVQRSLDGTNFTTVGVVEAAGNSSTLLSYNFIDKGVANIVSGYAYYRLHTIDNDATSEFSSVVSVDLSKDGPSKLQLAVKPMPFGSYLDLTFEADDKATTVVTLQDVTGKLITTREHATSAGINSIHLGELDNIPAGVYTLRIVSGFQVDIIKVVKQ
jgi:hypothetical protein